MLTAVTTLTQTRSAVLEDVSSAGARLRGADLPPVGEAVVLRVEGVQIFATVAWSQGEVCGLAFDGRLTARLTERLQRIGSTAVAVGLTAEEVTALREWQMGSVR